LFPSSSTGAGSVTRPRDSIALPSTRWGMGDSADVKVLCKGTKASS
jgi:hypothetical protein